MPTITGIVPSPDRPGHVVILVDGVPFATVPSEGAERFAIDAGADATEAPARGPVTSAEQKTYERALNLLAFRARSANELRKRLKEKGEPVEQIAPVIARLAANGLLDDARYAESRARTGIVGKARSKRRIQQDLVQRGVKREVADAAITQVLTEAGTDEAEVAERAARKKLRGLTKHPIEVQRQKLYGFLARQGYASEVVRKVMKRVLSGAGPIDA